MLSYQHIYHAGSWADVHKHAALCSLWSLMSAQSEGKPLTYIDTHAGRGLYDLQAPEAQKIAEYKTGITKLDLSRLPQNFAPYVKALRTYKPKYPGSAACIAAIKNKADQMHLCELHKGEIMHLQKAMNRIKGCKVLQQDGHEMLTSLLSGSRGKSTLVCIDPSYEVKQEYEDTARTALKALEKNKDAQIMIWYPVLFGKTYHETLIKTLDNAALSFIRSVMDAPIKPAPEKGIIKTGLIIINPPEGFERKLSQMTSLLSKIL